MQKLNNLRLPVIQAPMFLLSGPEMVINSCKAGIVGSFPTQNCRTLEALESWLQQITQTLNNDKSAAPWAANLVMHRTNPRRIDDLALVIKYEAPFVITALGSPKEAVDSVHAYGGKVFADVINIELAKKAVAAGVDGLVLICSGAGGHTGQLSPFSFIAEVRRFFDGDIILSGAIGCGRAIRAAEILGATFAYLGTRFIPTTECMASAEYKQMVIESSGADIVTSDAITGVPANWLRGSLINAGFDPNNMPKAGHIDAQKSSQDTKRWKDLWAAGQGVGSITQQQSIAEVVEELAKEYQTACQL